MQLTIQLETISRAQRNSDSHEYHLVASLEGISKCMQKVPPYNLNIKPGTACKHTVKCCLVLYFWQLLKLNLPDYLNNDPQNVIYRQINLMMVGSLQAN